MRVVDNEGFSKLKGSLGNRVQVNRVSDAAVIMTITGDGIFDVTRGTATNVAWCHASGSGVRRIV